MTYFVGELFVLAANRKGLGKFHRFEIDVFIAHCLPDFHQKRFWINTQLGTALTQKANKETKALMMGAATPFVIA